MFGKQALSVADRYWADQFGCWPPLPFAEPFLVHTQRNETTRPPTVHALFRGGSVMISIPPGEAAGLQIPLTTLRSKPTADTFAAVFQPVSSAILGPALIHYSETIPAPAHSARALGPEDAETIIAFRDACDPVDWESGGSLVDHSCSAVFVGSELVALAGYTIWGAALAHISVLTRRGFRDRGYGRAAVAHVAKRALNAGLLPQYRTLESNRPSLRVAESLGFSYYATSLAARLKPSV